MKLVLNTCHGGFGLSPDAIELYAQLSGLTLYGYVEFYQSKRQSFNLATYTPYDKNIHLPGTESLQQRYARVTYFYTQLANGEYNSTKDVLFQVNKIPRDDPNLITVVERLGRDVNTQCSNLEVVSVDVSNFIEEHDGYETFHKH